MTMKLLIYFEIPILNLKNIRNRYRKLTDKIARLSFNPDNHNLNV